MEHGDRPIDKEKSFEQSAKSLKEIGKCAADYDVSWNMEVVNRFENYMLNTAAEARKLADMVNHPNINILLDIFHGMIEEDDLAEAIRTAGSRLGHYHMGSNNRRPPRPGYLPWQQVVDALKEILLSHWCGQGDRLRWKAEMYGGICFRLMPMISIWTT